MSNGKFYSIIVAFILCTLLVIGVFFGYAYNTGGFAVNDNSSKAPTIDSQNDSIDNTLIKEEQDNEEATVPSQPQDFVVSEKSKEESKPVKKDVAVYKKETIENETTPIGAKIWPIKDLELYKKIPDGTDVTAKGNIQLRIKAGTPLTVILEEETYFKVEYNGKEGFISADYCLINLPDYYKELCRYDITNSYSSRFMAHDYILYGVTDNLLPGYENVKIGEKEFLVPFLYPSAKKLLNVAEYADSEGYSLKIYDAFRPRKATRYIYDTVNSYLYKHVPVKDRSGKELVILEKNGIPKFVEGLKYPPIDSYVTSDGSLVAYDNSYVILPAGSLSQFGNGFRIGQGGVVLDSNNRTVGTVRLNADGSVHDTTLVKADGTVIAGDGANDDSEEEIMLPPGVSLDEAMNTETYNNVITDGKYRLTQFLDAVGSPHNKGIAIDLTLVHREDREELDMQTKVHDLSYHSMTPYNNEETKLLHDMMEEGGFDICESKWWHFEDNATKDELDVKYSLEDGISP